MILVGNKSDLQNDRIISKSQGEELASKWGIKFIETSALRDTNVEQAFMTAPIKVCQDQELEAERRANNKSAKKSIKSCTIA